MQPILKWAGGKRWLASRIREQLPKGFKTYYEPFLGSGVFFFLLEPKKAVLSDVNPELVNCYQQIRDNCDDVIHVLKNLRFSKESYYFIRDKAYKNANAVHRAAYFIYLNRTCWNGLYRVNCEGHFNVPFGKFERVPIICDPDEIRQASRVLQGAKIVCSDFSKMLHKVKRDDFIYLDPPYITTHGNNGFIKYNRHLFNMADQKRLSVEIKRLAKVGSYVMHSNASHESVTSLYSVKYLNLYQLERRCNIAGDVSKRGKTQEMLVTSGFKVSTILDSGFTR